MTQNQVPQATYKGNDRVLFGFILGLLSFWMFAMTILNINPVMAEDLGIADPTAMNLAVSITSLFSGLFIVVAGGLADKYGRVLFTRIGFLFSIAGSLLVAITPKGSDFTLTTLILGRIFQGLSAAFIMPSTLALLRAYWDDKGRQRAVSLWSMGSWGGTSFSALVGGAIATNFHWRYIFWIAFAFSILGLFLIKDVPESKAENTGKKTRFDSLGVLLFMVAMVTLQLYLTQGSAKGWVHPMTLTLLAVAVLFLIFFVATEQKMKGDAFIDFSLFKNKTFTGATASNFILNGTAGVITITMLVLQQGGNLTADTAGYLTIGYGVTILLFIRVGEKLLQRFGARKPMIWGCLILIASLLLLLPTNLMTSTYMVLVVVAYLLFGLGLAFYATPSTDAALVNLPPDKTGAGSGIYKMASSLGTSFGLAISSAIYTQIRIADTPITILDNVVDFVGRTDNLVTRQAAMVAVLFNIVLLLLAILTIVRTIPKQKKQLKA